VWFETNVKVFEAAHEQHAAPRQLRVEQGERSKVSGQCREHGVAFEPGEKLSQALLVPLQRIAYRQVLYLALLKAMRAALKGWAPGWGKLERTGRVQTSS